MIYVLREAETGLLKVGKARNKHSAIRERMPAIAARRARKLGRRCTLELLHWLDWPGSAEMDIHRYCWRLWQGDEWFIDGQELREVLELANDGIGYFRFNAIVKASESMLPRRWTWHGRDKIIADHKQASAATELI